MREKFNEILEEHGIFGESVEDILGAIYDMVIYVANETKEKELYATNSIDRLETAAHEVWNLRNEL